MFTASFLPKEQDCLINIFLIDSVNFGLLLKKNLEFDRAKEHFMHVITYKSKLTEKSFSNNCLPLFLTAIAYDFMGNYEESTRCILSFISAYRNNGKDIEGASFEYYIGTNKPIVKNTVGNSVIHTIINRNDTNLSTILRWLDEDYRVAVSPLQQGPQAESSNKEISTEQTNKQSLLARRGKVNLLREAAIHSFKVTREEEAKRLLIKVEAEEKKLLQFLSLRNDLKGCSLDNLQAMRQRLEQLVSIITTKNQEVSIIRMSGEETQELFKKCMMEATSIRDEMSRQIRAEKTTDTSVTILSPTSTSNERGSILKHHRDIAKEQALKQLTAEERHKNREKERAEKQENYRLTHPTPLPLEVPIQDQTPSLRIAFKDKEWEIAWQTGEMREGFPDKTLEVLDDIAKMTSLGDLKEPSYDLKKLQSRDYKGMYSVRINDQYRVYFNWSSENGATNVIVFDPHIKA